MAKENSFRSQFKATTIKSLRKTVDKDDAMVGVNSNEYLSLEDGKTVKIRIFPAHPGQESFYVSRKCYWLPFINSEGEHKRGTVLDSVAHGNTKLDLVQEYVNFAKKRYGTDNDKMEVLIGTGMNSNSLRPQYSWLCYADIVREGEELHPKIWEFKKMVRDLLNKLAFSEDEDEPIEVDPFTDPDEGLPVLVKYIKNPNKKKGEQYYDVTFAKKSVARPLTDDELEAFAKLKPLNEIIPNYSIKEFDKALEGLQVFDEDNDFNLFDDDDWVEIVEKVRAQYESDDDDEKPAKKKTSKKIAVDEDEEDEEEKPVKKSTAKKKEVVDEDEDDEEGDDDNDAGNDEGDEFADMDRSELKKYIKSKDLDIVVKKSMSDDDLRNAIREAVNSDNSDDDEEANDDSDDEEEAEEKPSSKITLDEIRKKLAGKK
jgi:hypothetical protein